MVFFAKIFRQYLLGRHFTLRTDHSTLQRLRRTPEPIGQQARWCEIFEEFDFAIVHHPGRQHGNADAMSRRPCRQRGLTDQPQPFHDDTSASAHNRDIFHDDPRASSASVECHAPIRASSGTPARPHVTLDDQSQYIRVTARGAARFRVVTALPQRPCLATATSARRRDAADTAASNRDPLGDIAPGFDASADGGFEEFSSPRAAAAVPDRVQAIRAAKDEFLIPVTHGLDRDALATAYAADPKLAEFVELLFTRDEAPMPE